MIETWKDENKADKLWEKLNNKLRLLKELVYYLKCT